MYPYTCIHIHESIYMYPYTCKHIEICTPINTYLIYIHTNKHTYVCRQACTIYVSTYMNTHTDIHIYMYTWKYTYVYVYVSLHESYLSRVTYLHVYVCADSRGTPTARGRQCRMSKERTRGEWDWGVKNKNTHSTQINLNKQKLGEPWVYLNPVEQTLYSGVVPIKISLYESYKYRVTYLHVYTHMCIHMQIHKSLIYKCTQYSHTILTQYSCDTLTHSRTHTPTHPPAPMNHVKY